MITEYHRPETIADALALLGRKTPVTAPMGGGASFGQHTGAPIEVVDLQKLDLNRIESSGDTLSIGATATLAALEMSGHIDPEIRRAISLEGTGNLRQMATIAGALIRSTGRSFVSVAALALDAQMVWEPGSEAIPYADWLKAKTSVRRLLLTGIKLPLGVTFLFDYVARSKRDRPVALVAVAKWPSGRIRVAQGGFGDQPVLAYDGGQADRAVLAAKQAYSAAGDEWASAEYRSEMAGVLAARLLGK